MNKHLPARPSLTQLKHQAKDLLKNFRAGTQDAILLFQEHHPDLADRNAITLSDAQFVVARDYGFATWPKLKRHIELLTNVDNRVEKLRTAFAAGDRETRLRLLSPAHTKVRFENYDPDAAEISEADARLLVANEEGYAYWSKYESFLHLDPVVQAVIGAVRTGDLVKLREILRSDPRRRIRSGFRGICPQRNRSRMTRFLSSAYPKLYGAEPTPEGTITNLHANSWRCGRRG
jgi:hypothetical protein